MARFNDGVGDVLKEKEVYKFSWGKTIVILGVGLSHGNTNYDYLEIGKKALKSTRQQLRLKKIMNQLVWLWKILIIQLGKHLPEIVEKTSDVEEDIQSANKVTINESVKQKVTLTTPVVNVKPKTIVKQVNKPTEVPLVKTTKRQHCF